MKHSLLLPLITLIIFISGCGYGLMSKYERVPFYGYELNLVEEGNEKAKETIEAVFETEGFELVFDYEINGVSAYYTQDENSRITVMLYNKEIEKLIVSMAASKDKNNLQRKKQVINQRKESLVRTKSEFLKSGVFELRHVSKNY